MNWTSTWPDPCTLIFIPPHADSKKSKAIDLPNQGLLTHQQTRYINCRQSPPVPVAATSVASKEAVLVTFQHGVIWVGLWSENQGNTVWMEHTKCIGYVKPWSEFFAHFIWTVYVTMCIYIYIHCYILILPNVPQECQEVGEWKFCVIEHDPFADDSAITYWC
jgi:hypothetical protein